MESREPGAVYWERIEPFWASISIYDGPDRFLAEIAAAPKRVQHLFAVHWLVSEVCNGGFHQFFRNATGVVAPEALAGLRAMRLDVWAELLERALTMLGSPYPREYEARHAWLRAIEGKGGEHVPRAVWDPCHALDDAFYDWLHEEDARWERIADAYAAAHGGA